MGGIPWAMREMPLIDKPTTVIGYSLLKHSGNKHILGITATVDRDYCKYFTACYVSDEQVSNQLQQAFEKAFAAFKKAC